MLNSNIVFLGNYASVVRFRRFRVDTIVKYAIIAQICGDPFYVIDVVIRRHGGDSRFKIRDPWRVAD